MDGLDQAVTAISDALIALAYGVIPLQILFFFHRVRTQRTENIIIGILFALFIFLCGMTHLLNATHSPHLNTIFKALDAIVSIATVAVLGYLLPKILAWLKSVEEHNRCEQYLVQFFTIVLLPRSGTKAQLMNVIQRCLNHIFNREDIFICLKADAVDVGKDHSVVTLDWQYVAFIPKLVFDDNKSFFEQVVTFVRSSSFPDTDTTEAEQPTESTGLLQQQGPETAVFVDV